MDSSKAEQDDKLIKALVGVMDESDRLSALSDLALIHETLKDEVADDPRVVEMMGRIYPDWFNEPDPPAMPKRLRSVCITLPLDVAHEVVAFSECHCGELIAAPGNKTVDNKDARPCLWCACNAALYRATGESMYAPAD